jgi:Leucine-rich repeat (LRR) protein
MFEGLVNLVKLTLSSNWLQDIHEYAFKSLKNLVELDISGNNQIADLEDIQNLSNLRILKASKTGINDLSELTNFTQLTSLDVSNNDLSSLTVNDVNLLVNLFNVSELNFSKTKIKDEFLNAYFDAVSNRNSIKKLVIRNTFDRSVNGNCDQINMIDNLQNIAKLTNIEYLDLHGNGCNTNDGFSQKGLTMTSFFSSMNNLKYLDISDSAVWNLSGILRLRNLSQLKLWDKEGGISMSKDQCLQGLQDAVGLGIASDCYLLGKGTSQSKSFSPGAYTWVVPRNVTKVTLTGASGANGGSGGGGGGGGACYFFGNWANYTQGGAGGASGLANSINRSGGSNGGRCNPTRLNHVADSGRTGGDGGIGGLTHFGTQLFPLADQFTTTEPGTSLRGGIGGGGGSGGAEARQASCSENGGSGVGGSGGAGYNGYNVKIKTYQISVNPGDKINISVGVGGSGGAGGGGGFSNGCNEEIGGTSGSSGTSGADGFLKIEWDE